MEKVVIGFMLFSFSSVLALGTEEIPKEMEDCIHNLKPAYLRHLSYVKECEVFKQEIEDPWDMSYYECTQGKQDADTQGKNDFKRCQEISETLSYSQLQLVEQYFEEFMTA